jgi:T-box protein 20
MHRYQPRLHLVKWREGMMASGAFVSDLESEFFRTFVFPETVFTAVTAYQNQLVSFTRIVLFVSNDAAWSSVGALHSAL